MRFFSFKKNLILPKITGEIVNLSFLPHGEDCRTGKGIDFFSMAVPYYNSNDYKQAKEYLNKAMEEGLHPCLVSGAFCYLGIIEIKNENLQKAINLFIECLKCEKKPHDTTWQAASYLSIIYQAAHRFDEADALSEFAFYIKFNNKPKKLTSEIEMKIIEMVKNSTVA